jgi:O-antigen ligase
MIGQFLAQIKGFNSLMTPQYEQTYLAWVFKILLPVIVIFAYVSNLAYPLLMSLAGIFCLGYWRYASKLKWPLLVLLAAFIWIMVRSSWPATANLAHYAGWEKSGVLKLMFQTLWYVPVILAASFVTPDHAHKLFGLLLWFVIGLCCVLFIEIASRAGLYQWLSLKLYQPIRPDLALVKVSLAAYTLMMLFWPLCLWLGVSYRRQLIMALVATLVLLALVTSANAVLMALIISGLVFWLAKVWPKLWTTHGFAVESFMAGSVAVFLLGLPVFVHYAQTSGLIKRLPSRFPASWAERLGIWVTTTDKMFERPLTGWGFDYSRDFKQIPLHPHSLSLQTGLELGYIGLGLLVAFWITIILQNKGRAIAKSSALTDDFGSFELDTKAYALATAASYFTFAAFSFGMWQEWFLALAAISICALVLAKQAAVYVTSLQSSQQFSDA